MAGKQPHTGWALFCRFLPAAANGALGHPSLGCYGFLGQLLTRTLDAHDSPSNPPVRVSHVHGSAMLAAERLAFVKVQGSSLQGHHAAADLRLAVPGTVITGLHEAGNGACDLPALARPGRGADARRLLIHDRRDGPHVGAAEVIDGEAAGVEQTRALLLFRRIGAAVATSRGAWNPVAGVVLP